MRLDLSPFELRILLSWWEESHQGLFGTLDSLATLREVTLASRLTEALANGRAPAADARVRAIRHTEDVAARIIEETVAAAQPEVARRGYEFVYACVVHSLPREDPAYWSAVDLHIEPAGIARPTYLYFDSEVPVWRAGHSCIGADGEELRARLAEIVAGWLAGIDASETGSRIC